MQLSRAKNSTNEAIFNRELRMNEIESLIKFVQIYTSASWVHAQVHWLSFYMLLPSHWRRPEIDRNWIIHSSNQYWSKIMFFSSSFWCCFFFVRSSYIFDEAEFGELISEVWIKVPGNITEISWEWNRVKIKQTN